MTGSFSLPHTSIEILQHNQDVTWPLLLGEPWLSGHMHTPLTCRYVDVSCLPRTSGHSTLSSISSSRPESQRPPISTFRPASHPPARCPHRHFTPEDHSPLEDINRSEAVKTLLSNNFVFWTPATTTPSLLSFFVINSTFWLNDSVLRGKV